MPSYTLTEEDAHRILEIKLGASETEIKSAYKKLALKTHPDKNPKDSSASKRFLAVSEAYKRLTDEDFSDEDEYDDYDDEDEDFDISEIFAFKMFERMFFDGASGGQGSRTNRGNARANASAAAAAAASGGVQFTFPGMVGGGGGGCNCPDCRRRFGYEKAKPWREYIPKSQRTDIPKETVKEVDPSIHDNWLSDEEDRPKATKGTTKVKSKKALKRENAAKEQRAQIERQERQAKESKATDNHSHNTHHHQNQQHDSPGESHTHMNMNKVQKLKMKQEEERLKLEQEKAAKAAANTKKKGGKEPPTASQKSKKKVHDNNKNKNARQNNVDRDSDDESDSDDSDLDIEEMASRMGITDHHAHSNKSSKQGGQKSAKGGSGGSVTLESTAGSSAEFSTTATPSANHKYKVQITALQEMGFEYGQCVRAIERSFGSVELAATMLLQSQCPDEDDSANSNSNSNPTSTPASTPVVKPSPVTSTTRASPPQKPAPVVSKVAAKKVPPAVVPNSSPVLPATTSMPNKGAVKVNIAPGLDVVTTGRYSAAVSGNGAGRGGGGATSYLSASKGTGRSDAGAGIGMPAQRSAPPLPPGLTSSSVAAGGVVQSKQTSPPSTQQHRPSAGNSVLSGLGMNHALTDKSTDFDKLKNQQSRSPQSSPLSMPSQSMPAQFLSSQSMSNQRMPSQSMPSLSMPSQSMPSLSMPSQSMPSLSMPSQTMPTQSMPTQTMPTQTNTAASNSPSSKFFSMFSQETNGSPSSVGSNQGTDGYGDSLGSGLGLSMDNIGINIMGENDKQSKETFGFDSSFSDLLLNSAAGGGSGDLIGGGNSSAEGIASIFDTSVVGGGDGSNLHVSGLGLGMTGLGGGQNSSSTSLSSLLGGDHGTQSEVSMSHRQHNSDAPVFDMSSIIGTDTEASSSSAPSLSMETMLGSSLLMDTDHVEPLGNSSYHSPNNNVATSQVTAASIVKNGKPGPGVPSPGPGVASYSRSTHSHMVPGPIMGLSDSKLPLQAPTSPVSPSSSTSSGSTKCLYFNTSRGCRHGASCKFSHNSSFDGGGGASQVHQVGGRTNGMSSTSVGGVGAMTMSKKPCMFYSTAQGCKHGSACRFVHSNKYK